MLNFLKAIQDIESSKKDVILEAKYDLEDPDEIEKDSLEKDEQNNNPEDDVDTPPDEEQSDDGSVDDTEPSSNDDSFNDESFNDDSDSYGDDSYSYDDDSDSYGDDEEPVESDRSSPEIKVLTMTDQERNLANLRLMTDIGKLKRNIQNSIKTVSGISSHSKEHNIIGEEVLISLEDIIKDIDVFVDYRLSDVYETNSKTYLGLLERYSMCMELYKKSYDTYMTKEMGNY